MQRLASASVLPCLVALSLLGTFLITLAEDVRRVETDGPSLLDSTKDNYLSPRTRFVAVTQLPIPGGSTATDDDGGIYFVCYGPPDRSNEIEKTTRSRNAMNCCKAIDQVAASRQRFLPTLATEENLAFLNDSCARHITELPTLTTTYQKGSQQPMFAYLYPGNSNHTTSGGWIPPVVAEPDLSGRGNNKNIARIFQWDDGDSSTPQVELVDNEKAASIESLYDGKRVKDPDVPCFQACITSFVSAAGGMHRDMHHEIRIRPPEHVVSEKKKMSSFKYSLDLLLHLPADLFINVEDAVVITQPEAATVDLLIGSAVIDQEEPTFASPPHSFLVHIEAEGAANNSRVDGGEDDNSAVFVLQWITKLHLRYPTPLEGMSFSRVTMAPPVLVGGHAIRTDIESANGSSSTGEPERWVLDRTPPDTCPSPQLLVLWVAAGQKDDYGLVLVTTLLVALGGAVVMMRDIARVTRWV